LNPATRLKSAVGAWRVVRFGTIDSTNEEARRRALAGESDRLWILAGEQTAGRGRRGRDWISPRGNLHATALMIDPCPPALAPQLGFVAGVALAHAARDVVGAAGAGLKWPNDMMLTGAKCAGVLVEGVGLAGRRAGYAIGIGVNCACAPQGLGYPTSRLVAAGGQAIGASELFERLAERFDEALGVWRGGQGFERIRADWLDCAVGLGQPVAIESGAGRREGVFEGIDAGGRLLMRSERGLESVEAADLSLAPRPDAPSAARLSASRAPEGRAW
jgi:BirA family biotin operon repressor/biotin-[acetyl-CoA-carboxylase] ligase